MTRSSTQNRMSSNQNGSLTKMEPCVRIPYWHHHLGLENGSALGDTWPMLLCLLPLLLCSRFSTSRRAMALMEGLICTHSEATAYGTVIVFRWWSRRLGELTDDLLVSALRTLLPAPSSQGIEGQKSLLLLMPRQNELNRLSIYLSCYHNVRRFCTKKMHHIWFDVIITQTR
jgi:hypothetical protein